MSQAKRFLFPIALAYLTQCAVVRSAACHEVIDVVTLDEVRAVATYTVQNLPLQNETERAQVLEAFLKTSKYGVLVSKVCGSCLDHAPAMNLSDPQGNWMDYCGPDVYGSTSTHSALVLHPLDPESDAPLNGERKALVAFNGNSGFSLNFAFTTRFPPNVTERLLEANGGSGFPDVLLLGASSGLIAIGPDYMGTGESVDLDRSYLTAMPVQQITMVAWYSAMAYTSSVTKGCTRMTDVAITQGGSLGGASVIWGSLALRDQGITVERCFSHAGVYSNVLIAQGVIGQFLANPGGMTVGDMPAYLGAAIAAYSNELPYLLNTGTGQIMLNPSLRDTNDTSKDLLGWVFDEKVGVDALLERMPARNSELLEFVNPVLFGPIASAGATATFCDAEHATAAVASLCAALFTNAPLSVVADITFPVELCHSPADEIIPFLFSQLLLGSGNPSISVYDPPLDIMAPFGGHDEGLDMCQASLPTYLDRNPGTLTSTTVVNDDTGEVCPGVTLMVPPTSVPTSMPTLVPTSMQSSVPTSRPVESSAKSLLTAVAIAVTLIPLATEL